MSLTTWTAMATAMTLEGCTEASRCKGRGPVATISEETRLMVHDDGPGKGGVALSQSMLLMRSGENETLTARLLTADEEPDSATKDDSETVRWSIDDPSVATVEGGVIRALANGTATVTVSTPDGVWRAACTIIVSEEGENYRNNGMPGMPPGMGSRDGMSGKTGKSGKKNKNKKNKDSSSADVSMQLGIGGFPGGISMGTGGMRPGGGMPPGGQGGFPGQGGGPGGMPPGGGRPQGRPDAQNGMPGPGGMVADNSDATDPKGYVQTEGEVELSGQSFSSITTDANAVKVQGGKLVLTDCQLNKDGGDTSNNDGSSFYGLNSAVLAQKGAEISLNGGSITTDAIGANAIVAYGGRVEVSDMSIRCMGRLSRGIHATGGGSIEAHNLSILTHDANSSVIALDRGGGVVNVFGGRYDAAGADCAVLYSTGDLTVNGITGSSMQGEMGVIEGNNFIAINNSHLTSHANASSRGLMILQSGSGDAGEGLNGIITVAGGSLTMTDSQASLIEIVTNVTGKVTLDGVKLTIPSGILMTVDYNRRWQTFGATGVLVMQGQGTEYEGRIVVDEYSMAEVTVGQGTIWTGAYNVEDSAQATSLTLNGGTWSLTADSHVDHITLNQGAVIHKNGYKLHCNDLKKVAGTITD